MEVYESNLHLFHTDSFIEKTEWIPYAPQGVIGKNAPGNSVTYINLNRSRLTVGLCIVMGEDKPVTEIDKVCLAETMIDIEYHSLPFERLLWRQRKIGYTCMIYYTGKIICQRGKEQTRQ